MSNDIANMARRLRNLGWSLTPPKPVLTGSENLPSRLKSLRLSHRYSLTDVADKIGTSKSYVWQIEQKKENHNFSADLLFKFCALYGMTAEELYLGVEA